MPGIRVGEPLLPVAPAPAFGECAFGFVRRLAALNGFATLSRAVNVLGLGNLKPVDSDGPSPAWDRLSRLTGIRPDTLKAMCWSAGAMRSGRIAEFRALGHLRLEGGLVDPYHPRICPECLHENGVARMGWSIKYLVACVRHRTLLIERCPACGRKIVLATFEAVPPWTCVCGQDLRSIPTPPAPWEALRLAELIEAALPKGASYLPPGRSYALPTPLSAMELSDVLLLVHTVGHAASTPAQADAMAPRSRRFPRWPAPLPNDLESVQTRLRAGMKVLDRWPEAFQRLLEEVGSRHRPQCGERRAGWVFFSKIGVMLEYPPRGLDGYPLAPILEEVAEFCRLHAGVEIGNRLRPSFLQPPAIALRDILTPSTLAREARIPRERQRVLDRAFKRILLELSEEERLLPPARLAELVRQRTLVRFVILRDHMIHRRVAPPTTRPAVPNSP